MFKQMKKIKDIVEMLLSKYPGTRDSDQLLYMWVLKYKDSNLSNQGHSFKDFAIDYINGKYPSFESVSRVRRSLQEDREDLRGDIYNSRHKNEEEVRVNIHNL